MTMQDGIYVEGVSAFGVTEYFADRRRSSRGVANAVCHSLPIRMKREDALHIVNGEIDELLSTILCCTGSNFNLHNASTTVQEVTKLLIYLLTLSACL